MEMLPARIRNRSVESRDGRDDGVQRAEVAA